jgi:Periplasmic copper-binding protein (NosD)
MPAHAQGVARVFVSGLGLDTNPCTVNQPCRTFQQAYNTVPANGEIEVLDPAGYGTLTITHGISIQGHGWASISSQASCILCAAITVSVITSDPVMINGLVLDGLGNGFSGIYITSGPSVQILNTIVRRFRSGIEGDSTINGVLLIEDTVASDNGVGFSLAPPFGISFKATLNRVTVTNNQSGVSAQGNADTMIANSVISNNSSEGLFTIGNGVTSLAKSVFSGNGTGVSIGSGIVKSYGDNYLNDNGTPVMGSLTPVGMQ